MALGVFILWFCWFGFNGGSTVAMASDDAMVSAGLVCFNTNLAAALATVAALITSWVRYGKPDVSLTFNGALAGLVAITAGCDMLIRSVLPSSASLPVCSASSPLNFLITLSRLMTLSALFRALHERHVGHHCNRPVLHQ